MYLKRICNNVGDLSAGLLLLVEPPPLGGLAAHVGVAERGGAGSGMPHVPNKGQARF